MAASIFGPLAAVLVAIMPLVTLSSDWVVIGIGFIVAAANIFIGEKILRKN